MCTNEKEGKKMSDKQVQGKRESVVEVREFINTRSHMWEVPTELHNKFGQLFTKNGSIWSYLTDKSDALYSLNTAHEVVNATLTKASLVLGLPMSCGKINIHISKLNDEEVRKLFLEEGLIPSYMLPRPSLDKRDVCRLWMHEKGVIILYHEESGSQGRDNIEAHFYWIGPRPEAFDKVYEKLKGFYSDKAKKNPNVNVLIQTQSGYQIQTAGEVDHVFDPGNYQDSVVKMYENICESISSKNFDKGRLWIMHGKPGTGKTYLIRGLITAVGRDATFLMIPPDLILHVGSPGMVSVFLNHASNNDGRPLVIILEDADSALVPRGGDNMSFIQSLLNLTAGILGDALNVAILATTNVAKMQIEPALVRSGRLAGSAEFDCLPMERGKEVLASLLRKKNPEMSEDALEDLVEDKIKEPMTLSDIYALTYTSQGPSEEELKKIGMKTPKRVGF